MNRYSLRTSRYIGAMLMLLCLLNSIVAPALVAAQAGPGSVEQNSGVTDGSPLLPAASSGKIAFASNRDGGNYDIYVMNGDGSEVARLTTDARFDLAPALSPDGKKVAFASGRTGSNEIYVVNVDGTGETRLTSNGLNNVDPAWSPDGRKLVYSSGNKIAVMNADGSNQKTLSSSPFAKNQPAWSPDGSQIAFTLSENSNAEIYVMDADGANPTRVTDGNPHVDARPSWTPDGRIVFDSGRSGFSQIYVVNIDGTNLTRLTTNNSADTNAAVSPDGKYVTFDREGEVYVMNIDGSGPANITINGADDSNPSWQTPRDNGRIAFTSTRDDNQEIYIMDPDGQNQVRLTNNLGSDIAPAISPDGSKIAFESSREGGSGLYVMNSDGTGVTKLADTASDPAWSPDGTKIAYTNRSDRLVIINADGSNPIEVGDPGTQASHPSWSPEGRRIVFQGSRPRENFQIFVLDIESGNEINISNTNVYESTPVWSPDGSKIAYRHSCCSSSEIWVMNPDGSNQVRLTNNVIPDKDPSWSPDSTKIIFARSDSGDGVWFDIYTMNADGSAQTRLTQAAASNIQPSWGVQPRKSRAATYTISGSIHDNFDQPIAGVTVTLSGTTSASVITDGAGGYSFTKLAAGGNYTVTPSKQGYIFQPVNLSFENLRENIQADFNSTRAAFSITGRVLKSNESPLADVTMRLDGFGQPVTTKTDENGRYSFEGLPAGGAYKVTPFKQGFNFNPASRTTPNLSSNEAMDFVGSDAVGPTTVALADTTYSVQEELGELLVTVTRTGDTSVETVVNYSTQDGSAKQLRDFILASGRLTFAPGEPEKQIHLLVNEDSYVEGDETLTLKLTVSSGAQLGEKSEAVITIKDDAAEPASNPNDEARAFVHQQYHDFLNRQPDAGGLEYWTNEITKCGNDQLCINRRRAEISAAFFVESEFQESGYYIFRAYKAAFGQMPQYEGFMFDRSSVIGGKDLEQSKVQFIDRFINRDDFLERYPQDMAAEEFVNKLYQTAGIPRGADAPKQVKALAEGQASRADVLRQVIEVPEFKNREYHSAFVLMQYFGYLRRDPDMEGYNFWLDILNNREPNNYRGLVCAFISSAEYQDRFSSIHTHNDTECK